MRNLFFLVGLFLSTTLFADQTFVNESAILEEVYYGVPITLEIVEHDFPTDFYVSMGSGTIWEQVSSTYSWGDSRRYYASTPTILASSLKLGIHTGDRNSGTFSVLPTDESDATFTIQAASATFDDLDEIWWDDEFYLSWELDETTTPDRLILQYREMSSTWTTLDTISSSTKGVTLHNEFADEMTSFRLTYIGNAYGYTIGSTIADFLDPEFSVTNVDEIESVTWGDNQTITLKYEKERLSEYTYVLVMENGEAIDTIWVDDYESTYTTENNYNGSVTLYFVTEWGDTLDSVEIESRNKWFEVSPLTDEAYTVNSNIPFHWSYSDDYELVESYIAKNGSSTYATINADWELSRQYNYAVIEADTTLKFMFIVTDGVTEIVREVGPIIIQGHCRENELLVEIDRLNDIIDSLENQEPTRILVTLFKDVPTGVDDEVETEINPLSELHVNQGYIYYNNNASHMYIVNLTGQVVYERSGVEVERDIDVGDFSPGLYVLVAIEDDEYTFLKFTVD